MEPLTVPAVEAMHYSQLVGLVRERNRPSGGVRTVQTVAANAFLHRDSRVLEIGSNTGFTSVNLALLAGCRVVGIDVNPPSVEEARAYAAANLVAERVSFQVANATRLPFDDGQFDLVWASNVTSFIDDKVGALREYLRVLAPGGILAFVPIYYRSEPSAELVARVGAAINAPLRVWRKAEWIELCRTAAARQDAPLELVFERDYAYLDRAGELDAYCASILAKPHLAALPPDVRAAVGARYRAMMALFNENLQQCGFSILLFQKRLSPEEPELFLARDVTHVGA